MNRQAGSLPHIFRRALNPWLASGRRPSLLRMSAFNRTSSFRFRFSIFRRVQALQKFAPDFARVGRAVVLAKMENARPAIGGLFGQFRIAFYMTLDFGERLVHGGILVGRADELAEERVTVSFGSVGTARGNSSLGLATLFSLPGGAGSKG